MTAQDTTYILESEEETSRLANQHDVIKDEMGGLVAAPVDFETQPLHVLDSATADGTWLTNNLSSLLQRLTLGVPRRDLDPGSGRTVCVDPAHIRWHGYRHVQLA
jgi:hypothetical protein